MTRRLRGREAEARAVTAVLTAARDSGRGAVVLLTGERGVGRTAVLEDAVGRARRSGFAVGVAAAQETDQISPLAPLLVALRSGPSPLLSDVDFAELAGLHDQSVWLVDRIADLLMGAASRQPVLVGVDDVQWADRLSLFALRTLPSRLAAVPVVWLLGVRSTPGGEDVAEDVVDPGTAVTTVTLAPLSAAAVAQVARDVLGRPPDAPTTRLLEGAGGNASLVRALLDGLRAEGSRASPDAAGGEGPSLPPNLVRAVRRRLQDLSPGARRLLRVGAVLGPTFTPAAAARLLDGTVEADVLPWLDDVVGDGTLVDDGRLLGFRHELVRRAVYDDVAPSIRKSLHAAAAVQLRAVGASAADVAVHLERSAPTVEPAAVTIAPEPPPVPLRLPTEPPRPPAAATRPVSPDPGWESLTPAEERVARLVAAGHTNRSAAAELGVSSHTVASHVRAVFQKLHVTSRVQLSLRVGERT